MNNAKLLVLDIETAPAVVYSWGLHDQNHGIEQVKQDQHVLMWCAKWIGKGGILSDSLINYSEYKKNPTNDYHIALSAKKILDEADIVIGQNIDAFDLKWLNTLFLKYNISPPSEYKTVDLLKESRKQYYSLSHKLDFRGRQLNLGGKMEHEGFKLWLKVLDGDKHAWQRMLAYCKRDVLLTEEYYLKLRPRMKNHPNVNMFQEQPFGGRLKCPACSSPNLVKHGFNYYSGGRRQRFECKACGYRPTLNGKFDTATKTLMK